MIYRFIDEERSNFSVSAMCRVLKVTRQGYYAWRRRGLSMHTLEDAALSEKIVEIYYANKCVYGAPRIHACLKAHGIHTSQKRISRLMAEQNICGISKRKRPRTKSAAPQTSSAKDHMKRDFNAQRPNERWVADITYIDTKQGWLYLAIVEDLFSRKIVGWKTSSSMTTDLVEGALMDAVNKRHPLAGLIHHSDHGSQYRANSFVELLEEYGIQASMGSISSPWDNAPAEAAMSTIKAECIQSKVYMTREEANLELFEYIEGFYNTRRLHSTLGYVSPVEFEETYAAKETA